MNKSAIYKQPRKGNSKEPKIILSLKFFVTCNGYLVSGQWTTPIASNLFASRLRMCPSVAWLSHSWFYTCLLSLMDVGYVQVLHLMQSTQTVCFLRLFSENIFQHGRQCRWQFNLGVPASLLCVRHLQLQSRSLQLIEPLTFFSYKCLQAYFLIGGFQKIATIYLGVLRDVWHSCTAAPNLFPRV